MQACKLSCFICYLQVALTSAQQAANEAQRLQADLDAVQQQLHTSRQTTSDTEVGIVCCAFLHVGSPSAHCSLLYTLKCAATLLLVHLTCLTLALEGIICVVAVWPPCPLSVCWCSPRCMLSWSGFCHRHPSASIE